MDLDKTYDSKEFALSSLRLLMVARATCTRIRICCATRGDGGLQKLSALGGCIDWVFGDMEVRGWNLPGRENT